MEQLLRQRAESIWTAAIRSVLPDEAVRRALEHFHPQGRVFLVAAGKAAWQMAHAALAVLGADACQRSAGGRHRAVSALRRRQRAV